MRAALRFTTGEKRFWRPATTRLVASRLTSHSQGPGRVSSKSFTSKTWSRSGVPKIPKLERWASPQSWGPKPGGRGRRKVVGHHARRTAKEGEGGERHPTVPDRDERRQSMGVRILEQFQGVGSVLGGGPKGMGGSGNLAPERLAVRVSART